MRFDFQEARPRVFLAMLGLTILFRLVPYVLTSAGYEIDKTYPWNFSPMLPVCLYGAAFVGIRWVAIVGPLAAWLAGDVAIGLVVGRWDAAFHATQPFIYLAFAVGILAGYWLRGRVSFGAVLGLGLATPILFFLVSNLGVWLTSGMYPRTLAGLGECYVMGLPFFRYALLSQAVFLPILFSPLAVRPNVPTTSALRRREGMAA